jgi:hypothetical protein
MHLHSRPLTASGRLNSTLIQTVLYLVERCRTFGFEVTDDWQQISGSLG